MAVRVNFRLPWYMYICFNVAVKCATALDKHAILQASASVKAEGHCGDGCKMNAAEMIPNVRQENGVSSTNRSEAAAFGCDLVEVLRTYTHEFQEGIYEKSATLRCEGVPVWVQLSSKDRDTVHYLYRLEQSGINYWAISDVSCSSYVSAMAYSDSLDPGGVTGWQEAVTGGFTSSNMVVRCRVDPCDHIELRNVPSTHSEYSGVYSRDGVCACRPSYRKGSYYVYYVISTSFSGWIATEDPCTMSNISYGLRNVDNTGYIEDVSSNWKYHYFTWTTTYSMYVTCVAPSSWSSATAQHCGVTCALLPICIAIVLHR